VSFIAAAPVATEPELPHHPFWPAIAPAQAREVMQLDGSITTPRLIFALTEAVTAVNRDLARWRKEQEAAGYASLDAVPDEETGRLPFLYRRAVYETAAADLMERFIRFDSTGDGQKRAAEQEPAIDDHRRNAFWAVRDILGKPRSTVELI
jgi:hypothetical protein